MAQFSDPNQAVSFAGSNVWTAASDGNLEIVRILIDSGAHRADEPDENGYTCLHAAASYGHHDMLKYLLAQVAIDVNCKDEDGDSPLHYCEDVATATILLQHGADPSAPNSNGQTPADLAAEEERDEVAQFLNGVDPYRSERAEQTRAELVPPLDPSDTVHVTFEQLAEAAQSEGGLEGFHAAMDEEAAAGKRRRT